MRQFINLVFACLVVVSGRSFVQATELCQQDSQWKINVCVYTRNTATSNRNLFMLVRTKATDEVFQFQVPENVTSLEDFYSVLITYEDTLRGLNASMRAYMSTPQYASESVVVEVSNFANNYLLRLSRGIMDSGNTLDYMSDRINATAPIVTISGTVAIKSKETIYAETYFVTNKMTGLFQSWLLKCSACTTARRR